MIYLHYTASIWNTQRSCPTGTMEAWTRKGVFMMEKVKKLTESQKITKQIIQRDKELQKAANLIVRKFNEKSDEDCRFRDSFDLKEEWIDELEGAFRASAFFNREGFDIAAAFDDTMYRLIEINDETIMRILYPVLFYTLILKNYDNQEAANKRAKRGSKSWGKVNDVFNVPLASKQDNKKDKADASKRKELEALIEQAEQHEHELRERLIKEESRSLRFNMQELQDLLWHAENALYLLNSQKVSWLEVMAKRGLFAGAILESQKAHSKPIDTVLRLYVLNEIDEVVFRSEQMSNSERSPALPRNYLLSSFRMNDAVPLEYQLVPDYMEKRMFDIPEGALEEPFVIGDDFDLLYAQLSKTKFTHEDIDNILDYFFDAEQLKWYADCLESTEKYISEVINAIRKFVDSVKADKPIYENINERYLDLGNLYAPMKMKIFDN